MHIVFHASPLLAVSDRGFTSEPMTTILTRTVECAKRGDYEAARDAFVADLAALGRPAVTSVYKKRGSKGRAFAGFDDLTADPIKTNVALLPPAARAA